MAPLPSSSAAIMSTPSKSLFRKSPKARSSPPIRWGTDLAGGDARSIVPPCRAGWRSGTESCPCLHLVCGKPSPLVLLAHRFRIGWHDSGGLHPDLDLVL